ncbi:MAG: hypothetical protein HQ551_03420 [Desulfobacteraceae bacterium]|nr:hypothetical protein [Desulfobacteraceae bacterium]
MHISLPWRDIFESGYKYDIKAEDWLVGMGSVPSELFEELSGNMKSDMTTAIHDLPTEGFQQIRPKKKFDGQYFSKKK